MSTPPSQDDGWSRDARELVHAYRGEHHLSALDRARLQRALAERLAQANVSTPSLPPIQSRGVRVALTASAKRWLGGACLAVAAAGWFATSYQHRGTPKPTPLTAARPARLGGSAAASSGTAAPATQTEREVPASTAQARISPRAHANAPETKASPSRRLRAAKNVQAMTTSPRDAAKSVTDSSNAPQGASTVPNALPPRAAAVPATEALAAVVEAKPTSTASASESPHPQDATEARLEFAFMARIHAAMRGAKLRQALALCAEHERRWPHGIFQQERDGVRALATCKLQLAEGPSQARSFLTEYPHGALAPSVRAACDQQLKSQ